MLNTQNPEQLIYTSEELQLTILGGIRTDHLDRMRVTLKIEVANRKYPQYLDNAEMASLAVRHNIDLYNDTQVEKLIRKTAEKLETGTLGIAKAMHQLTNELEVYRLKEIEKQQQQRDTKKKLTPEETQAAIDYLKEKNLMQRTSEDIGKSGLVGEEQNRLLMYLIFTSRKTTRPLHAVSLGSSGTGKTYLQEKVGELIPAEEKLEITSLTENAFYYFGQTELRNKLILIEDLDGAENVLYPLRELQSKKRITKTVTLKDSKGQTKTISLTVEGPVSVAGCTTQEQIYEDNANRSFLIYLDESKEQDEKIMQYQRSQSAGTINHEEQQQIKTLLQNTQRVLQPLTVRNPYAEKLKIPHEVFKPRRTNAHYLAFIEAVTFYHQYQREQKADEQSGEIYIETTIEDIQHANKLMKNILLRKSDELSGACRNYFEKLKSHLQEVKQGQFTNKEIREKLRIPLSTLKRYHLDLFNNGRLKINHDQQTKSFTYEIVNYEEYQTLQQTITNVLDDTLHKITQTENAIGDTTQLTGSTSAQLNSEPQKKKKINKLSSSAR